MNKRLTSDSAKTVSLFPFLAVLLCTMGALLVLLVVLAQRAGERTLGEVLAEAVPPPVSTESAEVSNERSENAAEAERLTLELQKVKDYQTLLEELREQAEQRLKDEQSRLSHLERHNRELEEELARLFLASEQLKATEANQSVDQQQAEQELERLKELIADTESQLEVLREEQANGKKSYAIVPYRGPNGTYRKPVYIECRKDGIVIHPEGIRLQASDFRVPRWAGNPLAAALRATREHVNAEAMSAGAPDPPDPYPVILVRPDGIPQYSVARAAITSWDASFGYEFIDADWNLEFPEGPDPVLAREQEHAIMIARERLVRLIRSAPSKFQGTGFGGGGAVAGGGTSGTNGYGTGAGNGESDEGSVLARGHSAGSVTGSRFAGNESMEAGNHSDGNAADGDAQLGGIAGDGGFSGEGDLADTATSGNSEYGDEAGTDGGKGNQYANATGATGGVKGLPGSADKANGGLSGVSGGTTSGITTVGGGGSAGASGQIGSIADAKGRNWAIKDGGRGSVPIRRPIQVVVRKDQLAMLPSRHAIDGQGAAGTLISLDQSMSSISQEFVAALRARVDEWGLAGSGLYWRPVLQLNVGPDAQQTATQVVRLLKDSGVEVSLPETADASQGEPNRATR